MPSAGGRTGAVGTLPVHTTPWPPTFLLFSDIRYVGATDYAFMFFYTVCVMITLLHMLWALIYIPLQSDKLTNKLSLHISTIHDHDFNIPQKRNKSSHLDTNKDKDKATLPEALQHFDRAMLEKLEAEILPERSADVGVTFKDIAGLEFAKKCVQELICW